MKQLIKVMVALGLAGTLGACGDEDKPTPAEANPEPEAQPEAAPEQEPEPEAEPEPEFTGAFADAKATEVDDTDTFEALKYPVHVTFDDFGVPHVLAESMEDAVYVQGYLHAEARLAQMQLIRGVTTGKLARVAGALDDGLVDDDIEQRIFGFARVGQEIYDSLPEGSPSRRAVDAYTAGVNLFIARLRAGEVRIPNEVTLLVKAGSIEDWSPVDSLSIVRFQQFSLSFDADREIGITRSKQAAEATFSAEAEDPALAARAGIFQDLHRFAPADPAYQIPGFEAPVERRKSGEGVGRRAEASMAATSARSMEIAERFVRHKRSALYRQVWPDKGMSNSWAVSGAMTESGNPMLANDPHLSLDSPALFHEVHLVVEPREADVDGPAIDVFGAQFPGLPGILIGHNKNVGWALTTASYDYTDAFREQLVWKEGEQWPRVLHQGREVELEIVTDEVEIGGGLDGRVETVTFEYAIVPHRRGPLALEVRGGRVIKPEGDEAISYAWRGFEASDELSAIFGMMTATDVQEAEAALDNWVIGSQNLLFIDTSGNIFTTGKSYVPRRPPEAMTWHPTDNPQGQAPFFILSGTGEHDWLGQLDFDQVPHALNPEAGFIVTANNDQTGMTDDNDPFNDPHPYLGYDYDLGFRAGRIERLLTNADGNRPGDRKITLEDMATYQGDTLSDNDARLTPFLLAAARRAVEELATPGAHPDLADTLAERAGPGEPARLERLIAMLEGWDFVATDGLFGNPGEDQRRGASATSLFNFWQTGVIKRAFDDELGAAEGRFQPTSQQISKGLLFILEHPDQAATLDRRTGQSVLWDDLRTPEIAEGRDAIILHGLFDALVELEATFESDDPDQWLWGRLHQRTFKSIIPSLLPGVPHAFTWPQADEGFGEGFPTPGDNYNVNVCNAGVTDFRYNCGSGAILRLIIEMTPEGARSFNAMPGGQFWDKRSPHFRDQLALWLENKRKINHFQPSEVAGAVEQHTLLTP